ncbi:hypothetical protein BGZ60DRAFT_524467 [Tricladium varicosporioides]|nr:hypothetical protein BGZ60DRAFT_524467 [Hymenoscyphus varicosporioides]
MNEIIMECLTGLRAAPVKADQEMKARSSTATNAKARRKKKTRFRLTIPRRSQKLHPAFDAFELKQKTPHGTQTTVISPEDGIHSLNWAILTPLQPNAGFLKLPLEIRNRIYALALLHPNHPIGNTYIHPRKKLKRYINGEHTATSPPIITTYNTLTHICRQFYIDVVGSGLLYRWVTWDFSSPNHMCRYLSTINPAHKNVIKDIHVNFNATQSARSPPMAFFKMLVSIKNLTRLRLTITINKDLLVWRPGQYARIPSPGYPVFLRTHTIQNLKTDKWAMLKNTPLQHFGLKLVPRVAWGDTSSFFDPSLTMNGNYGLSVLEEEILGLIRGVEVDDKAVEDPGS